MKILICSNYSYPHIGGSEEVIRNIASRLGSKYKCDCYISSATTRNSFTHENVKYIPLPSYYKDFVSHVRSLKPDRIFIYGDNFLHFPDIVKNPSIMGASISIALLGMNAMEKDEDLLKSFLQHHNYFNVIVHSRYYRDYEQMEAYGILVSVIPNGVNPEEFCGAKEFFREKYNIRRNSKLCLCVANFFPGKGHDKIPEIMNTVRDLGYSEKIDFVIVYSDVLIPTSKYLEKQFEASLPILDNIKFHMLKNLPRTDVIEAFKDADIFVMPSEKEVFPIVLLESMAASLPWVSFNVGNSSKLTGGKSVDFSVTDFASAIVSILEFSSFGAELGKQGKEAVASSYNWNNIVDMYHSAFSK